MIFFSCYSWTILCFILCNMHRSLDTYISQIEICLDKIPWSSFLQVKYYLSSSITKQCCLWPGSPITVVLLGCCQPIAVFCRTQPQGRHHEQMKRKNCGNLQSYYEHGAHFANEFPINNTFDGKFASQFQVLTTTFPTYRWYEITRWQGNWR